MKYFNIYKRLYKLSGISAIRWLIPVILNSVQSIISFVGIGLATSIFVDNVLDSGANNITYGLFIICFVAVYLIILLPISNYWLENKVIEIRSGINNSIFTKILNGKYGNLENYGFSNIMNIFQNDIDAASDLFGWPLVTLFQAILSGCVATVIMAKLNIKLFILCVIVLSLICCSNIVANKHISKLTKKLQTLSIRRFLLLKDIINNLLIIVLYGRYSLFEDKIQNLSYYKSLREKKLRSLLSFKVFMENIVSTLLLDIILIVIGIPMVYNNQMTVGELIFFIKVKEGLLFFFLYTFGYINDIQNLICSAERITNFVDSNCQTKTLSTDLKQIDVLSKIELKDLSFGYTVNNDYKNILNNISLVAKGKYIGVLGSNGVGKSTLLKIIMGLYTDYKGEIYINECNIKELDLRNLFSYVPQDNVIFNASIKENITLNKNISSEKLIAICRSCCIYDDIIQTDDSFDTIINANNPILSGGQIRRIMLARALCQERSILILDEFESNIDIKTVKEIYSNIKKNYANISVISITHNSNLFESFDSLIQL